MGFVAKIIGRDTASASGKVANVKSSRNTGSLGDGPLDTLDSIFRTMGEFAFPLDDEIDKSAFAEQCAEFARHIANGSAVPKAEIPQSDDGSRAWAHVRRFYIDRRQAEYKHVSGRFGDYREIVQDLVVGLRDLGARDKATEESVKQCLGGFEKAVDAGSLPEIRNALSTTVDSIAKTFAEQKKQFEAQIAQMNARMSSLREDLMTAREEMKRDALTDAYNRGAFDTALEHSLNLNFVLQQPVCIVMIDLDNFKVINDSFGHGAGDDVLRGVADCLTRSFIRKNDIVARYGGEEFAIIIADTTAEVGATLVERFLTRVQDVNIPYAPAEHKLTCSAGITQMVSDDTAESVMQRADKALYEAKAAGRNCLRIAKLADS